MKRICLLTILISVLSFSCTSPSSKKTTSLISESSVSSSKDTSSSLPTHKIPFGVFLGEDDTNLSEFYKYESIAIDVDEFSTSSLEDLKNHNVKIYAYLSIGSLEKYRSYYEQFKDITFMDYDNWPDERWVDVSNLDWQNHISSEAYRFASLGVDGLFMDNFDVYYIALEEYECSAIFKEGIYKGCKDILENLSNTSLDLLINSGTNFLERMHEENDSLINMIDMYAQECVFSSIIDYENNVFGKQNNEDKQYYQSIISLMKNTAEILLIEYTIDEPLINEIIAYCDANNFNYHISKTVDLKLP